jgi:MFS family permease
MASRSSLVFQTHARASSSRDSGILTAPNNSPESHLKGWRLIVVICLLSGAAFTISLDDTVVATAIPRITDDFRSIADVSWYGSAYLLTMGGTQLLFGKLYALHIDKTIYIASMCIFAAGSTISATAPNSIVFIVGRAVAGVGAAGLMTGSFVICAHSTPLRMRPIYTGIVGSMTAVGSVLGPLLGGVITDNLSWRWIFWINLPIIGVLLILFVVFYHTTQPASSTRTPWRARIARYDLPGNFLFLSAVVCFQIALQWGGTQYPWQSKRVIILLVCSAVLLLAFVPLEKVLGEKATIPGRIASQRTVASSGVVSMLRLDNIPNDADPQVQFMALLGAAYYSSIYNLPLWFQGVKGSSPTESGIMSVALLISMVVS